MKSELRPLDARAILAYPTGGGVQVEKAGVVGFGMTFSDTAADWGRNFAKMTAAPMQVVHVEGEPNVVEVRVEAK